MMDREQEIDKLRAIRVSLTQALCKCNEILEFMDDFQTNAPLKKIFTPQKPYTCCNPRYTVQDVRLTAPNAKYDYLGYVRRLGTATYLLGYWDAYGREIPDAELQITHAGDLINLEENNDEG